MHALCFELLYNRFKYNNYNRFNYADDTSILCNDRDYDSAYNNLLSSASTMIHW